MQSNIRNFVIIAHIDHGKSTLADRMLEVTGTIPMRSMKPQYLDQLELERERGITIKMAPVRMIYQPTVRSSVFDVRNSNTEHPTSNGPAYMLNLIDTPGHSDFGYEVSRALMAVEGAILLVDATQGIQAQTLANFEQARKAGLKIIGAVNKIDVATPDQAATAVQDLAELLEVEESRVALISGKTGAGVSELLQAIIAEVPPPHSSPESNVSAEGGNSQMLNAPRALIFDSSYDEHKGVIAHVRIFGDSFTTLGKDDAPYRLAATSAIFRPKEVGYFAPQLKSDKELNSGEIGYIATGLKDPDQLRIGDTVILEENTPALPGFKIPHPVVFVSFYPEENDEYENLKTALGKLRLNDSALQFEADTSEVLGRGFKGGFLGQLHFEITAERLAREFNVETVHSFPSVAYRVNVKSGWQEIKNPKDFPSDFIVAEQPMAKIEILAPSDYLGAVLQLSQSFRFANIETRNFGNRIIVSAKIPLSDLIRDFDDQLKSSTQGFASLSYELAGYEKADVKKVEILVAGHILPGLTRIIAKEDVEREARKMVARLKDLLPKEQFSQAIQAQSDGRIIARETIPALRKDVTGYLYGGDRTRKMKLWKKQQRGKAKLKEMAETSQIKIPASVFKELLKK